MNERDWSLEYCEMRRLMGLRSTDFLGLIRSAAWCALNAPDWWGERFTNAIPEIEARMLMMNGVAPSIAIRSAFHRAADAAGVEWREGK